MENKQTKFKELKVLMWNHIYNINIENLVCLFSINSLKIFTTFFPRTNIRFELLIDILHAYESF